MITRDLCKLWHPDVPMAASYGTREKCEGWRAQLPLVAGRTRESYLIEPMPACQCCGAAFVSEGGSITTWGNGQTRCARHHDRNPCAIEGCGRTTAAPDGRLADDGWMCGEHWRRYVPPRSARRRAYHAFFRRAKRHGWDGPLRRKFWRFWNTLVASARRRSQEGQLDMRAINELFGWDG